MLKIYCKNTENYLDVEGGTTLTEVVDKIKDRLDFKPICARVNNKTENLSYQIYAPKQVEFLSVESPSGHRVYVRSLCMMLYKAVTDLYDGVRLNICHSVSKGYFCRLKGLEVTRETVESLKRRMAELVVEDMPFERFESLTSEVKEIFEKQGLRDKVRLLETTGELYTVYYKLGDTADSYYGPLAPATGFLGCFDLKPYHDGFLLLGPDPVNKDVPQQPVTQEKMFGAFTEYLRFNNVIGVSNVGELNRAVNENRSSDLINVAEALHDKKISSIADEITRRHAAGGCRLVMIAGPSSSGKTTFTKKLAIYLMTNLLTPKMISLDDYFVDRHLTPRDHTGDYDYESLYALNLERFNSDLCRLIAGEEVSLPSYSFEAGLSMEKGRKLRLEPNSILLIEGIHGLNPELTGQVEANNKYLIYVSALTTLAIDDHNWIPTTDNRLLRRIIRDHKYRGTSALSTIKRWPSVRRGEEKWIFPYQENADATFNSSLIFELGVMKPYALHLLENVPNDIPEYGEAYRLRRFLNYFTPIPDSKIPPTSLLREFLGGSSFHY